MPESARSQDTASLAWVSARAFPCVGFEPSSSAQPQRAASQCLVPGKASLQAFCVLASTAATLYLALEAPTSEHLPLYTHPITLF